MSEKSDILKELAGRCMSACEDAHGGFSDLDDDIVRQLGWSNRYYLPEDNTSGYPQVSLCGYRKPPPPKFSTSLDDIKLIIASVGDYTHYGVVRGLDGMYRAFVTVFIKAEGKSKMFYASHKDQDTLAMCAAALLAVAHHHE